MEIIYKKLCYTGIGGGDQKRAQVLRVIWREPKNINKKNWGNYVSLVIELIIWSKHVNTSYSNNNIQKYEEQCGDWDRYLKDLSGHKLLFSVAVNPTAFSFRLIRFSKKPKNLNEKDEEWDK